MKKNFMTGMGMGFAVGAVAAYTVTPKRKKTNITKTARAVSDIVDSVSDYMGW